MLFDFFVSSIFKEDFKNKLYVCIELKGLSNDILPRRDNFTI